MVPSRGPYIWYSSTWNSSFQRTLHMVPSEDPTYGTRLHGIIPSRNPTYHAWLQTFLSGGDVQGSVHGVGLSTSLQGIVPSRGPYIWFLPEDPTYGTRLHGIVPSRGPYIPRLATDVSLWGDVQGSVRGVGLSSSCVGFETVKRFLGADRVDIESNG